MDNLRLLTFIIIYCGASAAIKINELIVPGQLQHGKVKDVTLDCKFELENAKEMKDLVVKWYFEENNLVYQWFPGSGRNPEASSSWKDRIDLSFNVSSDGLTKYRAVKIINITTDITGEYTCQVSSFYNEASRTKTMVIYEPPRIFTFEQYANESILSCSAYGVFPKPVLKIYARNENLQANDEYEKLSDTEEEEDINDIEEAYGFYNVTTAYEYDPTSITEPMEFICELTIPNTNFNKTSKAIIEPENETTSTTSQYDFETTTMTTTTIQSIDPSVNSGIVLSLNVLVLSTTVLSVFSWYLQIRET